MRLFLAISLPGEVRLLLKQAQARLREAADTKGIGWTNPEQLHLTLVFLGETEASAAGELARRFERIASEAAAIELSLDGFGMFPNETRPRVLWAGVASAGDELPDLQRAFEIAAADALKAEKQKKWSAHITLARFRDCDRQAIRRIRDATRETKMPAARWTAPTVDLVRSDLGAPGATHTVLRRFLLGNS
ncbi:MAG TPA: RNA 2',3'-cyclic phosphodiesterase [Verrucomicrobiae bacterium]|nr:RNA 2',3'-cyclic phosphodiesterase [Verrucomicrobiae bacterium]